MGQRRMRAESAVGSHGEPRQAWACKFHGDRAVAEFFYSFFSWQRSRGKGAKVRSWWRSCAAEALRNSLSAGIRGCGGRFFLGRHMAEGTGRNSQAAG